MTSAAYSASIIVCTLDRAEYFEQALLALTRLEGQEFELIVVNGPSRDRTARLLSACDGLIKTAQCSEANISMSRNIGLSLASGDVVAFLDDDAVPHPYWLARLVERFRDERLGAVGGYTVGQGGRAFQARRIACDRYGESHVVSEYFDMATIGRPRDWLYPAPLGTNVAFRRTALAAIGNFDETFAYFLDETDACLRLVDAGWKIDFEAAALVWHQFAASRLRNGLAIPTGLRALATSKAYFVYRHGAAGGSPGELAAAACHLESFRAEKRGLLGRLAQAGAIDISDQVRLEQELDQGLALGFRAAARAIKTPDAAERSAEPSKPFLKFRPSLSVRKQRIAFICRNYPPRSEAGIARWTWLSATALAGRGHTIHVVAEAENAGGGISFTNGVWLHEIAAVSQGWESLAAQFGISPFAASWAEAVRRYLPTLEAFGLDLLSFPVWDVEGIGCFGVADVTVVVSLHTTAALSGGSRRMVRAEATALAEANLVLANTVAALADIEKSTGLVLGSRAVVVPHGIPLAPPRLQNERTKRLKLLFVGRNEPRKGIDIAADAIRLAFESGADVEAAFVGCEVGEAIRASLASTFESGRVSFLGFKPRAELEELYSAADIVVMPSRYESFGLVAIEAMAHGTPVIATAVGGLKEIVQDGENGVLVPLAGAPERIAAEILRLSKDRHALSALSIGARRSVETRFRLEVMAEHLEETFAKAIPYV